MNRMMHGRLPMAHTHTQTPLFDALCLMPFALQSDADRMTIMNKVKDGEITMDQAMKQIDEAKGCVHVPYYPHCLYITPLPHTKQPYNNVKWCNTESECPAASAADDPW